MPRNAGIMRKLRHETAAELLTEHQHNLTGLHLSEPGTHEEGRAKSALLTLFFFATSAVTQLGRFTYWRGRLGATWCSSSRNTRATYSGDLFRTRTGYESSQSICNITFKQNGTTMKQNQRSAYSRYHYSRGTCRKLARNAMQPLDKTHITFS